MDIRGFAAIGAALLLAGCSSGGVAQAAKPTPTVSMQTTCDRMFVQGDPRLWSRATTLVATQSQGGTVDDAEVKSVHKELAKIAESSKKQIRPHIAAMADTVNDLDGADTSDYKTAATEVANECTAYVAVD